MQKDKRPDAFFCVKRHFELPKRCRERREEHVWDNYRQNPFVSFYFFRNRKYIYAHKNFIKLMDDDKERERYICKIDDVEVFKKNFFVSE